MGFEVGRLVKVVTRRETLKEKEERVYFCGQFLRICLVWLRLHLRVWGSRLLKMEVEQDFEVGRQVQVVV